MMARQYRSAQIVKIAMATFTTIFLPCRLGGIATLLRDLYRATVRTPDPVGPPQLANGFITLDIIQQILKVDHRRGAWIAAVQNPSSVAPNPRQGEPSSTVWNPY